MRLKIGFIDCVKSSHEFLSVLLNMPGVEVSSFFTDAKALILLKEIIH